VKDDSGKTIFSSISLREKHSKNSKLEVTRSARSCNALDEVKTLLSVEPMPADPRCAQRDAQRRRMVELLALGSADSVTETVDERKAALVTQDIQAMPQLDTGHGKDKQNEKRFVDFLKQERTVAQNTLKVPRDMIHFANLGITLSSGGQERLLKSADSNDSYSCKASSARPLVESDTVVPWWKRIFKRTKRKQ